MTRTPVLLLCIILLALVGCGLNTPAPRDGANHAADRTMPIVSTVVSSSTPTTLPSASRSPAVTATLTSTRIVPTQLEPAVVPYQGPAVAGTEIIDFVPIGIPRDIGLVADRCDTFVIGGMACAPAYRCSLPTWVSPTGKSYSYGVSPCYVIPDRDDALRCAVPLRGPSTDDDPETPWGHYDSTGFLVAVPSSLAGDIAKRRAEWRPPAGSGVGAIVVLANGATCWPYQSQPPAILYQGKQVTPTWYCSRGPGGSRQDSLNPRLDGEVWRVMLFTGVTPAPAYPYFSAAEVIEMPIAKAWR